MTVHQSDNNMRKDTEFIKGELKFLVEGNKCRLLDGRRTEGYIEKYFEDSAMFRWKITKYEDKGKYWDLPAEKITNFQFEKDSITLDNKTCQLIKEKINTFQQTILIQPQEEHKIHTENQINVKKKEVITWLKNHSEFIKNNSTIDFSSNEPPKHLSTDLKDFMKSVNLDKEEQKTSENMVLNPNSGEWIKGLKITLAEMGLASFKGKIPRTKDIFHGIGSKENRRKYLLYRLGFIRAYFDLLNIKEVVLYRGMSNENNWKERTRTFLPCTFSLDVAQAFSDFDRNSKYRISYLLKMTIPVENLFMTYLETEAMNRQYKEREAIVLYNQIIKI